MKLVSSEPNNILPSSFLKVEGKNRALNSIEVFTSASFVVNAEQVEEVLEVDECTVDGHMFSLTKSGNNKLLDCLFRTASPNRELPGRRRSISERENTFAIRHFGVDILFPRDPKWEKPASYANQCEFQVAMAKRDNHSVFAFAKAPKCLYALEMFVRDLPKFPTMTAREQNACVSALATTIRSKKPKPESKVQLAEQEKVVPWQELFDGLLSQLPAYIKPRGFRACHLKCIQKAGYSYPLH